MQIPELLKSYNGLPISNNITAMMAKGLRKNIKLEVYGWHVDPNISDPYQAITYLGDAVSKTPSKMLPTYIIDTDFGVWGVDSEGYPYVLHDSWVDVYRLYTPMIDINKGQTITINNPAIVGKMVQIWFFTLDSEGKRITHTSEPVALPYIFTSSDDTKFFISIKYQDDSAITPFDMSYTLNDFSYGGWKDVFFMPKPCMLKYDGTVDYYLDENNYEFKKDIQHTTLHPTIVQGSIDYWPYTIGQSGTRVSTSTRCSTQSYITIPPFSKVVISVNKEDVVIGGIWSDTNMTYQGQLYSGFDKNRIELENDTATNKYIVLNTIGRMLPGDTPGSPSGTINPSYFDCIVEAQYQELSDISNVDYAGNAMMEWPLIWYKFVEGNIDGEGYFYCSNQQIDTDYRCWCNTDAYDNTTSHFYTAIYNGTIINGKMRSLSGLALGSNGGTAKSGNEEVTAALANNIDQSVLPEWYTAVWSDWQLITALLILMGKSLNLSAVFGKGYIIADGQQAANYVTGSAGNASGLFHGDTSGTQTSVKVFGMENWWGCIWHRRAGLNTSVPYYCYKLTYGTADGTSIVGYQGDSVAGYNPIMKDDIPLAYLADGYIKQMYFGKHGIIPLQVVSSSGLYYDGKAIGNRSSYLVTGGASGEGSMCIAVNNPFTASYVHIGSSLSCKPLKTTL